MATSGKKLPRGIDRLHNGTYRARLFVGGVQHSLGAYQTIGDARAALDIARSEKARGTFVPPADKRRNQKVEAELRARKATADSRSVREMFTAWSEYLEHRGLKFGTRYTYERRLEAHFLPEFENTGVGRILAEDVADWLDRLEKSKGSTTAAPVHQTVASMFRWASGDAPDLPRNFKPWVLASPVPPPSASKFRRPSSTPERNRTPASIEDVAALASNMPPAERMAVLLSGWCGLRLGEVLGLRRRHITTSGSGDNAVYWIKVETQVQARGSGVREETPKSRAGSRDVPVPPGLAPKLVEHLEQHTTKGRNGLLFPRHPGGDVHHHPNTIRSHFNEAMESVNAPRIAGEDLRDPLENFTFHGLRHSALTRLGQAGATTAELKAYAGHSDGASVERYQHAERSRLAALAGALTTTEGKE
ncbi:tyrosine-type recombinase/integrase [Citricoccus parietis]|uniref:Tyrosine-type recombinase/integrase n=1 Tax=Citricoccus parietis TaxID=592307 RepID=A0ABV6F5F7_9MICC